MLKAARILLVSVALVGTGALVTGCQTDPDIDITKLGVETDPPETLYNQGLANLRAGNISEASRKFDAIDRQHPFSEWARKALVMSTFTKYRLAKYDDAITAGTRFRRLGGPCILLQAGSFSAAARRLRISKSATSAHVQRLEERLGVRLLHRTTRRNLAHRGWRGILSALRPHRRRSGIRRAGSARAAA